MRVIVSLHDVTPFHLARLENAEALCKSLGLRKLTYLFVPDFHGQWLATAYPAFVAWCRRDRTFAVDWHLHGYHHREDIDVQSQSSASWNDALKRRFLTAGEGEFLALDAPTQRRRLEAGRTVFAKCLGHQPQGFVAPAWLFNAALLPLLAELGFCATEDHRRIVALQDRRVLLSPVITWATRTRFREMASILATPWLARLWTRVPVLRIALHPFDFDHPETIGSIRAILAFALRHREPSFWRDLTFADAKALGDPGLVVPRMASL